MSIYVHPDGYLQITEGHNIQDVSEGSIMWRMFRGWNQRRQAVGLDALAYIGTEFVPVTNLDDAKINVGANLQNYLFWQKLQKGLCEIIDRRFTVDAFFVATEAAFVPSPASGTYAGYRHSGVDVYGATSKYDVQQMGISDFDQRLFAPYVYLTPQSSPPFQSSPEWIADVGELIGGYVIIGSPLKVNIVNNLLRAYSSLRMMHYSFSGESKRGWGGHVSQLQNNLQYESCDATRTRAIANMTFVTNPYSFFYTAIEANAYVFDPSRYSYYASTIDTNDAGSCRLYMGAEINRRDFLIISSGLGDTRAVFENAYGVAEPFVLESRNVGNFSQDGTITVNHSDLHVDGRGGFESPIVLLNVNCNRLGRRSCMFDAVYQVKYKFADTP